MSRLVQGFGINNADYVVCPTISGKRVWCKFYHVWKDMIERCYTIKRRHKWPTYKDCTVCEGWRYFMHFRLWMVQEDYVEKAIDKDILVQDNKVYSPETCLFVTQTVNNLLNNHNNVRGRRPEGVCWYPRYKNFRAQINKYGKVITLGYFSTPEEAHAVYCQHKHAYILEVAFTQTDTRVRDGLIRIADNKYGTNK